MFPYARVPTCGQARDPRLLRRRMSEIARPTSPSGHNAMRQVGHRRDAGVPSEAKGEIVVAAGLEQGKRAFQMILRLAIFSGEPASDPGGAMGDAGLGRIRASPRRRRGRPSRAPASTATRRARSCRPISRSRPPTVRGASLSPDRRLAGSGECFRRFRRAVAARRDQRVAVGDVQCVSRCRCAAAALTSSVCASAASSACASAISGISGVGEKPSSAGARVA